MTRLTPVAPDPGSEDVWAAHVEARTILARIGKHPDWQQHRADAFAEVHPNLGRPRTKTPARTRAEIVEEVVFFAGLGMPTADVCERLKEKPGNIARALRVVGEERLADAFADYAKYLSGTSEARAARGEQKPRPKKFVSRSGMARCCTSRVHDVEVAKSQVRRDARSLVRHPDSATLRERLEVSQQMLAESERIASRHFGECDERGAA